MNKKSGIMLSAITHHFNRWIGRGWVPAALGAVLCATGASAQLAEPWALTNFTTGVVVTDSAGQDPAGNYLVGEIYNFEITFAESVLPMKQFAYDEPLPAGRLRYTLPAALEVAAPDSGGIYLTNGELAGHFAVDGSGNVEVWFEDVDNTGAATPGNNFIDHYLNVTFTLEIRAKIAQNTAPGTVILFGDGTSVSVTGVTAPPPSLKVETRVVTAYNRIREDVTLEVAITAMHGSFTSVTLADVLKLANNVSSTSIPSGGYTLASGLSNISWALDGVSQGAILPTFSGGAFNYTFPGTLAQGSVITLTYDLSLTSTWDLFDTNGWINRASFSATFTQDATANGLSPAPVSGNDTTTFTVANYAAGKSGTSRQSGTDHPYIDWTASVGCDNGSVSINGAQIVEELRATPAHRIDGDITVRFYSEPENDAWQTPVQIVLTPMQCASFFTSFVADEGFTYTVPNGYGGIADIRRITFLYKTVPVTGDGIAGTFYNKIYYDLGGKTYTSSDVGIYINKIVNRSDWQTLDYKWVGIGDDPDVINAIRFTTTLTVPAGQALDAEMCLGTYLRVWDASVPNQEIHVRLRPEFYESVTIDTTDLLGEQFGWYRYENFVHVNNGEITGSRPFEDEIWFGFVGDNPEDVYHYVYDEGEDEYFYQWPIQEEATITMVVTIPLDVEVEMAHRSSTGNWLEPVTYTGTLRPYVVDAQQEKTVWYVSRFWYADGGTSWLTFDREAERPFPVTKTVTESASGDGRVYDFSVFWNKWEYETLFQSEQPAIFTDVFDPRLEYVSNSFHVVSISASEEGYVFAPGTGAVHDMLEDLIEDWNSDGFKVSGNTIWADFSKWGTQIMMEDDWGVMALNDSDYWGPVNGWDWWYSDSDTGKPKMLGYAFEIRYQLRVKEEYLHDVLALENTATIIGNTECNDGKFVSTVAFGDKPVSKTIANVDGNILDVEIVINDKGLNLIPAGALDPTRFTAEDIMSGDLSLFASTLQIWTQTQVAGVWDNTWVPAPAPAPDGLWGIEYPAAQTLRFTLPNETPVKITYRVMVTVGVNQTASFANDCNLLGFTDGFADDNFTVLSIGATASGGDQTVTVFKRDSATQELLGGATFGTWGTMPDGSVPPGAISPFSTRSICGKTFYEMDVVYDMPYAPGIQSVYGNNVFIPDSPVIFAFEEINVPQGYAEPATPYTFFVIGSRDVSALETELGYPVQVVADIVTIYNDRISVRIGFDPNDGGPAPVVRDTFYHGQNYSPPAQDPVWGDRAFLGWFLGLQRVTSATEITRFDDHDVLGMWLDPRDDLDTESPDIGDLIPPPGTPGVTNGAPVVIVVVIDNGDGTTTTNNVTAHLDGDDETDGPYTIVIDDEGGLPEGDGTITNIIVNPGDEDELDLETDLPITVKPAGDPPTGSVWYIPEGAYYYTRLTDEVLAVYTPPTPLAGDLHGTMVRVLFSMVDGFPGEGPFTDGLVPTEYFGMPTDGYEDAYLRARPDGKYDVINPYPIHDGLIAGYDPVKGYDYAVTFVIAGDDNEGSALIRLYHPPEPEIEYETHYSLETDADLGWYFRGDLEPNTGGFAVENDLVRDDLIHGIIYTNSAKTLGVPFTGYIHDEYFLPEDDVAKARPLHRIIADELPDLPEDDYEVVIFFDNTLPWPGSPCDQNYDPLAAEHCWFIEGTIRLEARAPFRYEFANVLYAERPNQSPAIYFPEDTPYTGNWLTREGTVMFFGWPATDVFLEDNTAQAGENSAMVLINGTIPRQWARGAAYPTRIDLVVTDYNGEHHVGTALEYIFIALAPGVSANTDLAPDGNGSIGHYTLPGDLNPADTALTYPGDIPAKHPDGKLIVTLYVTDGTEGSSVIPPAPIVGPIHGYIDTNGNIVPTDEFGNVIEFPYFPPGDGYHLVVIAEERGTPRKLGWGPFNRAPGTVDYVDGVNPEDDDIIIGTFDPPVGFDGDPSELDVVVIIDDEPVEGAWIDEEGNIHIPGLPDGIEPGSTIKVEIIITDGDGSELYSNKDDPETLDVYNPPGVTITDPLEVDDDDTDIPVGTFDPGDDPNVPLDNGTNVTIVIIGDDGEENPVPGSIDDDGNITIDEIPEGLFGEDLDVIVTVTDDNGNPMGDGKGKITIRKGKIRIADAATAEEDDPVVGKYTDHGIDDPDVLTNLTVEVWIGAEGPFPGYIDGDGNIRVRGRIPERLVGEDVPIEIVISDTVEGKDGPAKRVYNRQSGLIDIIAPTQDGALRITSITLTTDSSQKDWITITVDGCYNWSKAYSLFGDSVLARQADPANTDQIGDANWYRPTKVQAQAHAEAIFTFPKPVDAHFFYHAREIPR